MPNIRFRQSVINRLKPLLPRKWKLLPYGTNLDTLSVTVVMLTIQSITRTPAAPQSHRTYAATLSIFQPSTDPERLNDPLDDDLIDLLNAIDELEDVKWTKAERVLGNNDSNYGFDITIEVVYGKDTSNA